jgi:RNA polymerase primary sigma factor
MAKNPQFDDAGLRAYLKEIEQYKLLTREEEERLGRLVAQGDTEARDRMIRSNLRLVVRIAREFGHCGLSLPDLVAEGNIGLMKAVERFNPDEGARFSTYAIWWIRQTIRRAIQTSGPTVRVPGYMVELISKWRKASEDLTSRLNRPPSTDEMAARLEMSPKRIRVIRRALHASHFSPGASPDMMWLFEDVLVDEKARSPEQGLLEASDHEMIQRCLAAISAREGEILRLRYGLDSGEPMTLQEIGQRLGVTRERVRQLESDALRKLARAMSRFEHGLPPEGKAPRKKPRPRAALPTKAEAKPRKSSRKAK